MILRELLASVGMQVDGSGFQRAESAIENVSRGFDALKQLAGAATVAVVGVIGATAQAAAEVTVLSQELGLSTSAFQEMNFAAKQSGVSTEAMVAGLKTLAHNLQLASLGGEEAVKNFRQLGISVGYGRKHFESADVWLGRIAEKFEALPPDANRTAIAMGIFGESGLKLLPLLNKGRAGLDELRQAAYAYGVVLDEKALAAGQAFTAATRQFTAAAQGLAYAIGLPLMEALTPFITQAAEWVRVNRELASSDIVEAVMRLARALRTIKQLLDPYVDGLKKVLTNTTLLKVVGLVLASVLAFKVGVALAALKVQLVAVAGIFQLVIGVMETMSKLELVFAAASAAAGAASAAAATLTAAAWGAAFLGLAVLLALVIEDVYTFFVDGDSAIGKYGQMWSNKLDDILKPRADDNWLERWFKNIAAAIFDVQGAWLKLKASLGEGFKSFKQILGPLSSVADSFLDPEKSVLSAQTAGDLLKTSGGMTGVVTDAVNGLLGDRVNQLADYLVPDQPAASVDRMFGGGASPQASAALQSSSTTTNSKVDARTYSPQVNVTVNGGNPEEVKAAVGEALQSHFNEAHAAVQGG